jgi:hypothetical protein
VWYNDSVCSGKLMIFGFVSRIGCVISRRYWISRSDLVSLSDGVGCGG